MKCREPFHLNTHWLILTLLSLHQLISDNIFHNCILGSFYFLIHNCVGWPATAFMSPDAKLALTGCCYLCPFAVHSLSLFSDKFLASNLGYADNFFQSFNVECADWLFFKHFWGSSFYLLAVVCDTWKCGVIKNLVALLTKPLEGLSFM